ncbi:hypothetical protein [Streptomyces netropsis]|uniref:Uncharacterized protein n=1 Tax=Streptomyces netropsis TaxID=55404 RepID=A0A7W7LI40_STRNE|nr:hypothetical protein [Streptomyces netropsis]MBB4890605.1 hypothetical protein [Streptomyces netropsis]
MSSTAGVPVDGEGRGPGVGGVLGEGAGGAGDAGESPLFPPLAGPVPPGVPGIVTGPGPAPPVPMRASGPVVVVEDAPRGASGVLGAPDGLRRGPWDDGLPGSPSSGISFTPPVGGTTPDRDVPGPAAPVAT